MIRSDPRLTVIMASAADRTQPIPYGRLGGRGWQAAARYRRDRRCDSVTSGSGPGPHWAWPR
eukprot:430134-Hanusia_phi.AAC.1